MKWIPELEVIERNKRAIKIFKENVLSALGEFEEKLNVHPILTIDNKDDFTILKDDEAFIRLRDKIKLETKCLLKLVKK